MGVTTQTRASVFPGNANLLIGGLASTRGVQSAGTDDPGGASHQAPEARLYLAQHAAKRNAGNLTQNSQSGGRLRAGSLWRRLLRACALFVSILALSLAVGAQDAMVNFDPATTQVTFTLAATLHTVHGVFKLKSGQIHFDPQTGKAGGAIVLDATSANTDNASRDSKMHAEILESAKFPEITFIPTQVTGPLADLLAGKGTAQLQLAGIFRLHGQDHAMIIPVSVSPASASAASGQFQASTKFDVPYVKWGLKNPSTFVLRVSDTVSLEIHSAVQIPRLTANR